MLFAALSISVVLAGAAERVERPNVLIVMSDQLNPRYLGCAGHPSLRTPNLDRLAREGVRFSAAYSNAPVCAPARAATFYGKYPTELGLLTNGFELRTDGLHLAEHLAAAGYATGISGKSHILPLERGRRTFQWSYDLSGGVITAGSIHTTYGRYLTELFDRHPELFPRGHWRSFDKHRHNEYFLDELDNLHGTSRIPAEHYASTLITRNAVRFIDETVRTEQPFFLFASYFAPHHPYYPPVPYDTLVDPDQVQLPPNFRATSMRGRTGTPEYSEREWREIIAHYSGLVSLLDEQVGTLLARLEHHGILDDTLIVFVADHGDMMGEFGSLFKGRLEDASARVPLLLRYGDRVRRGLVVGEPVEQVDIFATCLAAAGLELPAGTRGRSLLGLAQEDPEPWKEYAFCVNQGEGGGLAMLVRDERYKFALQGSRHHEERLRPFLFDMLADPFEMNDLIEDAAHAEPRARLEEALRTWWAEQRALEPPETTERLERARRARDAESAARAPVPAEPVDDLTRLQTASESLLLRLELYRERRARMLQRVEDARAKGPRAWSRAERRRATIRGELERMTRAWRFELGRMSGERDGAPPELASLCLAVVSEWAALGEPPDVLAIVAKSEPLTRALAAAPEADTRRDLLDDVADRTAATPGLSPDEAREQAAAWERLLRAE